MYTLTRNSSIVGDGASLSGTKSIQSDGLTKLQITLAANSVNIEVDASIVLAQAQGIVMLAPAATTVKTNSTSAPDNTIPLLAGEDSTWMTGEAGCQITADVTKLYLSSVLGGIVNIWAYVNSTP